jgi:Zn finger protein HypA/HybF involved in hydrogenase expression
MATYIDLVNVEEFWDKKDDFNKERWPVSFYCKNCEKIVETERPDPKGYTFVCNECSSEDIVIWTQEGLKQNYRLK